MFQAVKLLLINGYILFLEKAMELASYWEQHKNASEFDWSISFNDEIVFEMIHNPVQLPEDLFI